MLVWLTKEKLLWYGSPEPDNCAESADATTAPDVSSKKKK